MSILSVERTKPFAIYKQFYETFLTYIIVTCIMTPICIMIYKNFLCIHIYIYIYIKCIVTNNASRVLEYNYTNIKKIRT